MAVLVGCQKCGRKEKMTESQYLNEERYQKNKKKLIRIAATIAIVGTLIGGGLTIGGIVKMSAAEQIDDSWSSLQDDLWFDRSKKKSKEEFAGGSMIMFGVFIIIASLAVSGGIYMIAKRREIMAFQVQQIAPVAKEGIEKAAPVVGKATGEIAKAAAPGMSSVAGGIAKEVAKGIKEGLAEEPSKKEAKRE